MARPLVLLVHADPVVRPDYLAQLPPGVDFAIVNSPHGAFSSAYDKLAADLRAKHPTRTLLDALALHAKEDPDGRPVFLATFSAGYAMARAILSDPGSALGLVGYVAIDSCHTGLVDEHGKRVANRAGLSWLVSYAKRAAEPGGPLCWLGHTDVHTPQTGPSAFASTTQVAAALREAVGEDRENFRIERWAQKGAEEAAWHRAALRPIGPEFLGRALRSVGLGASHAANSPQPAPARDEIPTLDLTPADENALRLDLPARAPGAPLTLGERALAWCLAELAAGVKESPLGSNTGPRIREYFAICERGGRPIGINSGEWCAAGQSRALFEALGNTNVGLGEGAPHWFRVAVHELVEDARKAGSWRDVSEGYIPSPGDLAIWSRAGEDPRRSGKGHVSRLVRFAGPTPSLPTLEELTAARPVTVDANNGTAWGIVEHDDLSHLVGWIAYP